MRLKSIVMLYQKESDISKEKTKLKQNLELSG